MTILDQPWPEEPRLAKVYDVECAGRWDHDFYLDLAARLSAGSVVDVGCGTGVFAVDAASRGLCSVGVDPAAAVLDIARTRPGGEKVEWIEGDLRSVASGTADLVIMMGHVAQYFVGDEEWTDALSQVRRVLVPGGHLAFETRNPMVDWAAEWTRARSEVTLPHPDGGEFTSWVEVQDRFGEPTSYTMTHEGNTVLPDGTHLRASETLRFRSADEVLATLDVAGFDLVDSWGDWDRSPHEADSREMIVLATTSHR